MQRRRQQPITIRSNRAAERLWRLAVDGRSQASIIEEALDRMPLPDRKPSQAEIEATKARILELASRIRHRIPSMAEFDAREYDERGNLR